MIVSIVNQKGGTGKTTTAINLSCALAKYTKKVLLIEMDSQGHIAYSFALPKNKITISEVLLKEADIQHAIVMKEGVSIVPGDIRLADVELNITDEKNKWFLLKQAIEPVKNNFDYVIIDCSPSLSLLTLNALCASNKVIIPLQMSVLDVNGLLQISDTVYKVRQFLNKELEILGILPVIVDKRKKLTNEIFDYLYENIELKMFKNYIRSNIKAAEAPSFGKSVMAYAPKSGVATDYMNFAKELIQLN
jgi:chromosome partitioning protein